MARLLLVFLLAWASAVRAQPSAGLDNSDRGLRIGIIGAGPAGLVAAADLMARGFRDVTVLEAADQVGGKVVAEAVFEYFPHFDAQGFREGLPQQLIAMQGRGGVYFTGALMNFETVELSAQHARHIVAQYFP